MKTKELIKHLQEVDPSGEEEVVVDNEPIYCVSKVPAYYDGVMGQLIHDKSLDPFYNIVGYKIRSKGDKVRLQVMELDWFLLDYPEAPVDLSELSDCYKEYWENKVEELREESREINEEVDKDLEEE